MLSLSMMWFCMKRMPRFIALLLNFITIFLTVFVLVGCYNNSHLATYLVRYEFDSESPFYSILQNTFQQNSSKTVGLEKIKVKAGYLNVCLEDIPSEYFGNSSYVSSVCYNKNTIEKAAIYKDVSLTLLNVQQTSNATTTSGKLNIIDLARITTADVIHPYILMATVVLTILMFLLVVYVTIPYNIPLKNMINKLLLVWSSVLVLVWGIGATWGHIGIDATEKYVQAASLGIVKVHKGIKTQTMTWFAFSFLLIDCLIIWILYIRDLRSLNDKIDEVHSKEAYDYPPRDRDTAGKYASDSSSMDSRV